MLLKSNLSSPGGLANFSSLKKIIVGIPPLFSKLLRKAFKKHNSNGFIKYY